MECLAHVLAGAFKGGVQSIKSDDGEVDTELTRQNMQKCITWTKKIQKGARSLQESVPCKYIGRGLQGRSAINKVG